MVSDGIASRVREISVGCSLSSVSFLAHVNLRSECLLINIFFWDAQIIWDNWDPINQQFSPKQN